MEFSLDFYTVDPGLREHISGDYLKGTLPDLISMSISLDKWAFADIIGKVDIEKLPWSYFFDTNLLLNKSLIIKDEIWSDKTLI